MTDWSRQPIEAVTTTGSWQDERAAALALDDLVDEIGLFTVYKEVQGYFVQRRLDQEDSDCRIDRILSPRQQLIDAGWKHGPVGVEIKAPNKKVGPVIAQMLDYSRAIWTIPSGFHFYIGYVFLWHLEPQGNTLASIMAQHRLGTACTDHHWHKLWLASGETNVLRIKQDGSIHINDKAYRVGLRSGSR